MLITTMPYQALRTGVKVIVSVAPAPPPVAAATALGRGRIQVCELAGSLPRTSWAS
ncbi:hypothetical protein U2F26_22480 [Micromonospora sp. 4G57]|uniref:Uncharacterized protein n=1 Tax=Micromonospora sicca TaxID=2202420 RepID=A0ABU5JET3_9ACTN|nr:MULTISPECIES: hypothetical protein [unclassified Micromonospora]MDZ5445463.1 hypothetical protein [Micromonospora sp. 4G57]MDZ5491127.1 hypothetical protein [Micromonospora sp. 4G53]